MRKYTLVQRPPNLNIHQNPGKFSKQFPEPHPQRFDPAGGVRSMCSNFRLSGEPEVRAGPRTTLREPVLGLEAKDSHTNPTAS